MARLQSAFRRAACTALSALAVSSAFALSAEDAAAQPTEDTRVGTNNGSGFDLHLFRPAVDSKGFFTTNGSDILGANDVSLGLIMDYGYGLMPLENREPDYIVDHAFQGTFQFNYGLANVLSIGITAPVVINDGQPVQDIGPTGQTYDDDRVDAQGLGHLALHAKWRIMRPDADYPFGLALLVQGGPSVALTEDGGSEPGFWFWPQLVLEKRLGSTQFFKVAANVGFRGHTGDNPQYGLGADGNPQLTEGEWEYGNLVTTNLGVSLRVLPALDLVGETYGTILLAEADSSQKLSFEGIGGIKLFVDRNSFLQIGGGAGYLPGFQAADARATIGFIFEPSIGDLDGDGIKDDEDDCPTEPEDFDGFQDTREDSPPGQYGCPDPDNDNDGILDVDDRCPNNPEDRDGDEDEDGCPEGDDGDRDGDGILDSRDKCPDDPEDRDGFEDKDGCPDPDNDKDGIPDVEDNCPNDPEDKDGFEDEDGCPDPDNDKDGIPDVRDDCPLEPETFNGKDDEDGCPDKGQVIIQENNILILEKILFKTGSAEILPQSMGIVQAVAATLKNNPDLKLIEIQGHADERSSDAFNLRLTKDRANAVKNALVKDGVPDKRVRAMGYGEYCPLDDRSVPEAWEKNRRVEFKVVRTEDGPTGVELGCKKAKDNGVQSPPP